jgi:hypothetical protein
MCRYVQTMLQYTLNGTWHDCDVTADPKPLSKGTCDDLRVPILANLDVAQPAEQNELEMEYCAVVAALLGTALLHRDDLIQVCT